MKHLITKLIKIYPKLTIALSAIALLALVVFTMHLTHPIITWALILIASGFCYMIWRSGKWLIPGLLLLYCLFIVAILLKYTTVFNSYMYELRKSDYSKEYTHHTNLSDMRISCNQIIHRTQIDTIIRRGYTTTRYSLFSKNTDTLYITDRNVKSVALYNDTLIDTLRIDGVTCGDTVTTIKRKPYMDRNFSLIRTNKKFINSNWNLIDTTYFSNKSSHIGNWELNYIFNDTRAEYKYDKYITKYTLKLIDESKVDTLDTKSDALGLLNAKCKDKATTAGKLIYTEYDACKNNNIVSTIKIKERVVCGYSKVLLEYDLGSVAYTPTNCMYKSNYGWTYEYQ